CAEHHDDAPVLARVRDRLRAAADEVEIPDLARAEDPEPAQVALRRHVDVAVRGQRRRRDEEQMLPLDPGGELLVDLLVDLPHSSSVACAGWRVCSASEASSSAPTIPRSCGCGTHATSVWSST